MPRKVNVGFHLRSTQPTRLPPSYFIPPTSYLIPPPSNRLLYGFVVKFANEHIMSMYPRLIIMTAIAASNNEATLANALEPPSPINR